MLHVGSLAARLEHRHHQAEATPATVTRAARVAVELGLAALTCRPEHLTVASAALKCARAGQGGSDDGSHPVELTTALEFHTKRAAFPPTDELLDEGRRLRQDGATDLAFLLDRERLCPQMRAADDMLAALCEDQAVRGGRIRVHLDTTGLANEQIAEVAARADRAGAWMVQTGTWQGERSGFQTTQIVRRALSDPVLVKWGYPLQTPATMLLSVAAGIDRFNAESPGHLLRTARTSSDNGWLTVPLEGLDF